MNFSKKFDSHSMMVIKNMLGAFVIKGGAVIISVLLLPAYMKFFENRTILGIWYTILSVLHWVTLFDLGLGNGLRNKLPFLIENNDKKGIKEYISTTYISMSLIAFLVIIAGNFAIPYANWNAILNVAPELISNANLADSVRIVFFGVVFHLVLKIISSVLFALQKSALISLLSLISNSIILVCLWILPSYDLATNLKTMSYINVVAINLPQIVATIVVFTGTLKGLWPSLKFFRKVHVKGILDIGLSVLWLQLVYMVVSHTNEMLISNLTEPDNVVAFQAYSKIFHTGSTIIALALTPIWSAVTKAQAKKDYNWIIKIYKLFLLTAAGCFLVELCIVPVSQFIMDIWFGKGVIQVQYSYGVVFAISSTIMIVYNINASIGNGMSYFKVQKIWITFAAVVFIPLSYLMVKLAGSWIGVVISSCISLLPYQIFAPIYTIRLLKEKISRKV